MNRMIGATLVAAALLLPRVAAAEVAVWPGFVRLGPGYGMAVVDEIRRGTVVRGLGCAEGWCRVTYGRGTVGYVEAVLLAPGDGMPGLVERADGDRCFVAFRPIFRGDLPQRICPAEPVPAPPAR